MNEKMSKHNSVIEEKYSWFKKIEGSSSGGEESKETWILKIFLGWLC